MEADGRSRAWINGAPVTARLLQTLGLEGRAAGIAALKTRTAEAQAAYREAALCLHGRRERAAAEWGPAMTRNLRALGMPDGGFEITVTVVSDAPPSPVGFDRVEFMVTANPGQAPRPLGAADPEVRRGDAVPSPALSLSGRNRPAVD